jgi:hypothetical protein
MTFETLLASHPAADVLGVADTVVGGLLTASETAVATGVAVWVSDRKPKDTVYDEAGTIIVDSDVLTMQALETGQHLVLTDGRRYVVTGAGAVKRGSSSVHHLKFPARRIPSSA